MNNLIKTWNVFKRSSMHDIDTQKTFERACRNTNNTIELLEELDRLKAEKHHQSLEKIKVQAIREACNYGREWMKSQAYFDICMRDTIDAIEGYGEQLLKQGGSDK